MIFSIIHGLTHGLTENVNNLSLLHGPFVLGLVTGGAMIYWFTGASTQAVTTRRLRAVEFIKANIKLDGAASASIADSKKVVEICTKYAQKGMLNIFIACSLRRWRLLSSSRFSSSAYLFSIAIFGLVQAISWPMPAARGQRQENRGSGAEQKGTPLHDAYRGGRYGGRSVKDTSSVALNPVIKFTTLFGLLAVELARATDRHARQRFNTYFCRRHSSWFRSSSCIGRSTECAFAKTQLTEDWFWCSDFRSHKEGRLWPPSLFR